MTTTTPTGTPSLIVHETLSGVIVHVTPLSFLTLRALKQQVEALFPYPDPEPYRHAISTAADPSIRTPAEDDPEYQELCRGVDQERENWLRDAVLEVACTYPQWPDRASMIAHFRPRLEQLRQYAVMHTDDWKNVLDHCVYTGISDRSLVRNAALQNQDIPLSAPEVVDGIRWFRIEIPGARG